MEKKDTSSKAVPGERKNGHGDYFATIAAMLFENVIGIKMYLVASVGAVLSCTVRNLK